MQSLQTALIGVSILAMFTCVHTNAFAREADHGENVGHTEIPRDWPNERETVSGGPPPQSPDGSNNLGYKAP